MIFARFSVIVVWFALLSGCSSQPQISATDLFSDSYKVIEVAAYNVADAYEIGAISFDDAQKAKDALQTAKLAVDAAVEAYVNKDYEVSIELVQKALRLVSDRENLYLKSYEKGEEYWTRPQWFS